MKKPVCSFVCQFYVPEQGLWCARNYAPELMQPELCGRIKSGTLRMIGVSCLFLKNSFAFPFTVKSFVEIYRCGSLLLTKTVRLPVWTVRAGWVLKAWMTKILKGNENLVYEIMVRGDKKWTSQNDRKVWIDINSFVSEGFKAFIVSPDAL